MKFLFLALLLLSPNARALDAEDKKKIEDIFENAKPKVMPSVEVNEFTRFTTPSGDQCRVHMVGDRHYISCTKKSGL